MLKKLEAMWSMAEAEVTKELKQRDCFVAIAPRNDKIGACLAMTEREVAHDDKEERNARFIFAGFDTRANSVLNGVTDSLRADLRAGYFCLPKAFRIMPVKMLNIPAIVNRAVSTALPMAIARVVVYI